MSNTDYQVQLLFSTLAAIEAENPVLLEGEQWTEKNASTGHSTGRRKVGDGVTVFTSLPFEPSGTGSSTASGVDFTPAGTISATDVQAAIEELDNDARMSNARTPTTHASSHGTGGSDAITLAQSQVTGLSTALAAKADTASLATVATTGAYADLTGRPTLGTAAATASTDYAPAAQGVANGNSHDHSGGDGAQIAYSSLSGLPALGSLAALSALGNITSAGAIGSTANLPIITTTGGALTTGSFGTGANTFCQGNDSRLSDARTPLSHTHGNISNAGAIGSTSGLPIITGASGVLQTGSFGTTSGTFCQGNDSRLSDARTPTAHNQAWSTITATPTTLAGYGITDAQPLDSDLTSIAALTTTTFGRQFLDRADAAAGRTHLGLGTAATSAASAFAASGAVTGSGLTMATARILGRTTASTGAVEEITVGSGLSLSGGTLTATGGGGSLTVRDEGTDLSTAVTAINFTGAGVTATGTSTVTVDIPGGGGGGGNSFTTIAVAGQSDVVADSSTDTLAIAAGPGIAITTNASTDTVTLAATGPSLGLTLAISYGMAMP